MGSLHFWVWGLSTERPRSHCIISCNKNTLFISHTNKLYLKCCLRALPSCLEAVGECNSWIPCFYLVLFLHGPLSPGEVSLALFYMENKLVLQGWGSGAGLQFKWRWAFIPGEQSQVSKSGKNWIIWQPSEIMSKLVLFRDLPPANRKASESSMR